MSSRVDWRTVARTLRRRWWFLERGGFERLVGDPTAQGFEIVTRHPGFADWAHCHDLGPALMRPFPKLGYKAVQWFIFEFSRTLYRLGLFVPFTSVALAKNELIFDCTLSVESVLRGLKLRLAESGRFSCSRFVDKPFWGDRTRIKSASASITFTPSDVNPNAIVADLRRLLDHLKRKSQRGQRLPVHCNAIVAVIETFLKKDGRFLAHRAKRLRKMPKSKMGRQRQSRIKRLAAETIALGCVALDWKAAGLALGDLTEWLQEEGISLKALLGDKKYPRWDHALRALESCIKPGKSRIAISAHKFMTPSSPKRHKVDAFITEQYECDYYAQHLDEIPPPNTRARREYNLRQGVRRSHSQSISAE